MTTKAELAAWFDRGVTQGDTHMIVVCDTFDHEDFPVYANGDADVFAKHKEHDGENMQRIMEVYDLRSNKAEQMNATRVMRMPQKAV